MLTPQLDRQELEEGNFVGLGWFISQTGSEFDFGHDGGNHGFLARLKILPDEGKGIAILVNYVTFQICHPVDLGPTLFRPCS